MFIRNAFQKFKAEFEEANSTISSPSLRSSRITSSDGSKHSFDVLQEPTNGDNLSAIPFKSADENDHVPVDLPHKRNPFQSLQHNPSVPSDASLPSMESDAPSWPLQLDFDKPTKQTSVLGDSENVSVTLPDPRRNEFAKVSALLAQRSTKPESTSYDTVNDFGQPMQKTDLLSIASKSLNGHGVSDMPQLKEMPESSNSTSDSVEVVVYPVEAHSVTQTSQSHDESVIQTSLSTIIDDNDDDDPQHTSETKQLPDIPQPPSLTLKKSPAPNSIVKELSVPGDFPLDKPSASANVQNSPLSPDNNPISPENNQKARRKASSLNPFLLNLAAPPVAEVPDKVKPPKTPWGPPLGSLQRISQSGDSLTSYDLSPKDTLAQRMGELGRIRRMESRSQMSQSKPSSETTSPRPFQPNWTANAGLRSQLQTLQEDSSDSDMATLLKGEYVERQQTLQTQLDKALAELRDAQAENKRLTSENQSQQRSISQLKIALGEAKHEQHRSLTQVNSQLREATSSLSVLNKEKKGWQDKLDSMQHKVNAAERQVRCLDHLTRHKFESRQEASYGQPKRKGLFASTSASTDVIALMRALNEDIYQMCVQLVEGLAWSSTFSTNHKPQVQKVLGDHVTAMMEDQAIKASGGYNMLLMQTVLEVFMAHWCSSIIEAFYPQRESFADLLVQLSATQTTKTSGSTTICGKQIQIIQSSKSDTVKFNEWVQDILKDLGNFLMIAGVKIKLQSLPLYSTKILAIVKVAYDLRTAMAEKDICGGLEVVIVPPDAPFQEKWMIDAHADRRKIGSTTNQSHVDFVAGTSGIGLQRKVSETVNGQFRSRMEIELKPKVILARALDVKE